MQGQLRARGAVLYSTEVMDSTRMHSSRGTVENGKGGGEIRDTIILICVVVDIQQESRCTIDYSRIKEVELIIYC